MKNKINKQGKKDFINLKNKRGKYNAGKFNEINTNKEQNFNIRENENINFISNIDAKYRNELNERMDSLMKKIDQNIMSNKYNQYNMIIHNSKVNYINNYNNVIPENNESEEKEKDEDNIENVEEEGEINEDEKVDETSSKQDKKNEETFSLKNQNENNINSNNDNKNEEIINKLLKRTKYLENELNYLKYKLNNVESQKNFVQDIIKNDTYIKRHLFDIFTVDYFKKIALNWKTISNELIDELIMDEIHELTKVKLKLRHINRIEEEDSEQEQNEEKKELSPIDMEEFILFNENLKGIKQTIKSVKESERNLCKKYKIKFK